MLVLVERAPWHDGRSFRVFRETLARLRTGVVGSGQRFVRVREGGLSGHRVRHLLRAALVSSRLRELRTVG